MSSLPAHLTIAERRERLALACELDRLRLRLALRLPLSNGTAPAIAGVPLSSLNQAFSIAQLLPGKIGRWSRRAALGAELLSAFNPFKR